MALVDEGNADGGSDAAATRATAAGFSAFAQPEFSRQASAPPVDGHAERLAANGNFQCLALLDGGQPARARLKCYFEAIAEVIRRRESSR